MTETLTWLEPISQLRGPYLDGLGQTSRPKRDSFLIERTKMDPTFTWVQYFTVLYSEQRSVIIEFSIGQIGIRYKRQ